MPDPYPARREQLRLRGKSFELFDVRVERLVETLRGGGRRAWAAGPRTPVVYLYLDRLTGRRLTMPKHIGIVACSAEGATLCYRTIVAEAAKDLGPYDHPELSMHSHSLAEYFRHIGRGDWEAVGGLMLSSAGKLARAGADFLICPDNTIHEALPLIEKRSPLPWLHIAGIVADTAADRGFRRVGLTGTRWLVESGVYPEKLRKRGVDFLRPTAEERETINRIILDELVHGLITAEALTSFQRIIQRMKDAGCDAVVLGCTEIPLLMNDSNSPLPTLDSTRLLARAALKRALAV